MRVVLDTNILLSTLIAAHSPPFRIYQAWRQGRFELLTSDAQLAELTAATRYPRLRARIAPAEAGRMVNLIRANATLIAKPHTVSASPDPDDNRILAIAEAGSADYLVSSDLGDLVALERYAGTRIVSARIFIQQVLQD
ncbi:putative toxin-antitoxin system toxin component, PIN family [Salinisphaera sp. P385]|uniref:Toxin-antitoxin system toxin component, PIN family n=1 Tax=Spectribacter acetivorans TaxID=3075603 RepID=A0ABU3B621_9GAMM|nr:putative toxin-antitoxin system toxin component, PIN family [Salinisphaera sp. P385]MDT0617891.1 putative toxin-antitoxin system toxin component, PIN family [Salinisphaera sp. P385]